MSVLCVWCRFIVEVSFIGVGNQNIHKKAPNHRMSLTIRCIKYTSPCVGIELTIIVEMNTAQIGICESNNHVTVATKGLWLRCLTPHSTIYRDSQFYCNGGDGNHRKSLTNLITYSSRKRHERGSNS